MEAYDTNDMNAASSIANENLNKVTVREALDRAMEKAGITIEKAIEPIEDALKFVDDDPRTELDMRLKGSDRALKLMGADSPKNNGATNNFNFNFGEQTLELKSQDA